MLNNKNVPDESFFCPDSVNECFYTHSDTNIILLSFMYNQGYRTVTEFANVVGIARSRLSQIIHNHIPADRPLKIKIAKALETDSRIIFPEDNKMDKILPDLSSDKNEKGGISKNG